MKIKDVLGESSIVKQAAKDAVAKMTGRVTELERVTRIANSNMEQAIKLVDLADDVEGEDKLRKILKQIKKELVDAKKAIRKKP